MAMTLFAELTERLAAAVRQDVQALLARHPGKHVYGLNLATDGGCQSLYLALSSREGLAAELAKPGAQERLPHLAWFLEDVNIDELGETSAVTQLSAWLFYEQDEAWNAAYEATYGEDYFERYKADIVSAFCDALLQSGVKSLLPPNTCLAVTDSEPDEALANQTSARLNSPEVQQAFLQRHLPEY